MVEVGEMVEVVELVELACHVKCDACPACPVRKYDCIGVKFEVRKYFNREGAYFTVVAGYWIEKNKFPVSNIQYLF